MLSCTLLFVLDALISFLALLLVGLACKFFLLDGVLCKSYLCNFICLKFKQNIFYKNVTNVNFQNE